MKGVFDVQCRVDLDHGVAAVMDQSRVLICERFLGTTWEEESYIGMERTTGNQRVYVESIRWLLFPLKRSDRYYFILSLFDQYLHNNTNVIMRLLF